MVPAKCCVVFVVLNTDSDPGRTEQMGQTLAHFFTHTTASGNNKLMLASEDYDHPHCLCQHVLGRCP